MAQDALPAYRQKNSPKKFTHHQLFACLVLKNFLKTDCRGGIEHLADSPELGGAIELFYLPHLKTLQKAAKRLLMKRFAQKLLDETVKQHVGRRKFVLDTAFDSTGLSAACASAYFVKRRQGKDSPWKTMLYHRYPKLGIVSDVSNHFILTFQSGRGPKPDVNEFESLILQANDRVTMVRVIADAG